MQSELRRMYQTQLKKPQRQPQNMALDLHADVELMIFFIFIFIEFFIFFCLKYISYYLFTAWEVACVAEISSSKAAKGLRLCFLFMLPRTLSLHFILTVEKGKIPRYCSDRASDSEWYHMQREKVLLHTLQCLLLHFCVVCFIFFV